MELKIKRIKENAILPKYAHNGDAGMDLFSTEKYIIPPNHRVLVSTGLQVEIPKGYEMQIRPRSGLALKHGISLPNSPGTVDSGYREELGIIIINHGSKPFTINPRDRIAQAVINKIETPQIIEVSELSKTPRGKGFGSSGIK